MIIYFIQYILLVHIDQVLQLIENGMVRINVMDHKTVDTYVLVQVILLPEEFEWLKRMYNTSAKKFKK